MELNIEKFDPTKEELNKMVTASKKITVTDINDKEQIEVVRKARIELKGARVAITKRGKEMREEANAFQKAVIAKEKELVAIIEPEEIRLEAIEEEVKEKKLKEERVALLPARHEQLTAIGDSVIVSDEELLGMGDAMFFAYKNERVAQKNEADRLALEEAQLKVQAEADRQQREKETLEREKNVREEAQIEAERNLAFAKEEAEMRVQQEKEDADRRVKEAEEKARVEAENQKQRVKQEKEDADLAEKADQARLESQKKYNSWREKNGWTEETAEKFYFENSEKEIKMYKLVSTFSR